MTDHHRFLLQLHLQHIDALDAAITAIDREVDIHAEPFHAEVLLLPGVSDLSAYVIRDRWRHEPLSDRGKPDLLGRFLSQE